MFRKIFKKPERSPHQKFLSNILDIMKATILGSQKDIKSITDSQLHNIKKITFRLIPLFYKGKMLEEIKTDIDKIIKGTERKEFFAPFYYFPPTIFHMAKYIKMHKLMSLKEYPLKPPGAKIAWDPKMSEDIHARHLSYLDGFKGKFPSFKLKTDLPFMVSTIEKSKKLLSHVKPVKLQGEYLLKYYAFAALELSVLGFHGHEKKIDENFLRLAKKDKNFERFFDYKLFLLKLLAMLGVAKPEILQIQKLDY